MFQVWTVLAVGLAYVGFLFAVATWGDRLARSRTPGTPRPFTYALTLAVYCTSWTYFGSVGVASRSGFEFVPIYLGPILVFALGWPVVRAIVNIAKRQNIASITDFIAARYGKSQALGALVAVIAIIGVVPYISIQLKALSFALETVTLQQSWQFSNVVPLPFSGDLALFATLALALFAFLFGTFVTFVMLGGPSALIEAYRTNADVTRLFEAGPAGGRWLTMTLLSVFAILLLPRQFHVTVVENASGADVRRAAWQFPLYLVAINIFVIPIAIAGLILLKGKGLDGDTFVLALPVAAGNEWITLIAFIGGVSAATAMVIVETIALAIMACNNVVVPLLLRRNAGDGQVHLGMGQRLIAIRRWAILFILMLAYSYYWIALTWSRLPASSIFISGKAIPRACFKAFLNRGWSSTTTTRCPPCFSPTRAACFVFPQG